MCSTESCSAGELPSVRPKLDKDWRESRPELRMRAETTWQAKPKRTMGVIVGNRGFFLDHLAKAGHQEIAFGGAGVAEIPKLQDLLHFICANGFEHHVAANLRATRQRWFTRPLLVIFAGTCTHTRASRISSVGRRLIEWPS